MSTKMKPSSLISGVALGAMLAVSSASQAAIWSSTSFLMHSGTDYKNAFTNADYDQTTVTLEHADGWKYGDNFFFFDISEPNNPSSGFYGEFSPRLSLGKISGKDLSFGFVKDVSLAATWEFGEVTNAKLFGFGFDLDIPGVPVAKVNIYNRYSENSNFPGEVSSAPQVTLVWMAPFSIGYTNWLFEGFLDYAWAEKEVGKTEDNIVAQPRLLMDVGDLWGAPKQLYAGIEYMYWKNKFGQKGVDDEGVPQLTVKWTF
ncbi:outer membrane protein OmpK [Thiomicrorhabdus sp.]|uniref:outer membrane protein OmpK n=1 Tax=Thiomicrorhabdus sp. TaxID=2039724 RepID=UPI0029C83D3E|nr:outer membrane protein OmpK [Thiomicrorhabdus sp.]